MTTAEADLLWEEVGALAFYLHWPLDTLLDLPHQIRGRLLEQSQRLAHAAEGVERYGLKTRLIGPRLAWATEGRLSAVPMTTGVQRPHRTLLRLLELSSSLDSRGVVAPTLRHAKDLAPAGRIAVKVSSAQRASASRSTTCPRARCSATITHRSPGPPANRAGRFSRPTTRLSPDDDAPTTSGVITPTRSSASASHASTPDVREPLPRPSTSRPRRRVSTSPVPLPPQGVSRPLGSKATGSGAPESRRRAR